MIHKLQGVGMEKDKDKFWITKRYTPNDLHNVFKYAIIPHLLISAILSSYIILRYSILEGCVCMVLSIVMSYLINKKAGLI